MINIVFSDLYCKLVVSEEQAQLVDNINDFSFHFPIQFRLLSRCVLLKFFCLWINISKVYISQY